MGLLDRFMPKRKKPKPEARASSTGTDAEVEMLMKESRAVADFAQGLVDIKDIIAPSAIEVDFNHLVIGKKYFRSYFTIDYPSSVL